MPCGNCFLIFWYAWQLFYAKMRCKMATHIWYFKLPALFLDKIWNLGQTDSLTILDHIAALGSEPVDICFK